MSPICGCVNRAVSNYLPRGGGRSFFSEDNIIIEEEVVSECRSLGLVKKLREVSLSSIQISVCREF